MSSSSDSQFDSSKAQSSLFAQCLACRTVRWLWEVPDGTNVMKSYCWDLMERGSKWTMNNEQPCCPVTEIGKCTSPSKEMNQLQKTIWGEEIFTLKFGLENSGNGGTLQVLATTCHTADTCRHRFSKDLCRIRGHVSMTNKNWQRRQREMACVCLDHTKASCLYAQVLTVCLQ
jgi:hypothetical protein